MTTEAQPNVQTIAFTSKIVSAYVTNNHVQLSELSALIRDTHAALAELGVTSTAPAAPKATPAEIRRSITEDHLISFEDGKRYKTLRRHLTMRGLTPQQYREKHGLPTDYPLTSASYSAQRSKLAKNLGLGQQRRKQATDPVAA